MSLLETYKDSSKAKPILTENLRLATDDATQLHDNGSKPGGDVKIKQSPSLTCLATIQVDLTRMKRSPAETIKAQNRNNTEAGRADVSINRSSQI